MAVAGRSDEVIQPVVADRRTTYAVWEITLKCNLACSHCGSRAGSERSDELSTEEALDLVRQLAEVGIREVTLIGGEAFLRRDWLDIAREVNRQGMVCTMTTGGYGISRRTAEKMRDAGISRVSVSVDGLRETHDRLRGVEGSWDRCFETLGHFQQVGLLSGCNTQINRLSAPELPRLYQQIRDHGATAWQIQLTVPMGNAADNNEILLQPAELNDMYDMLAVVVERAQREGVIVMPGNNIGYYGPYEFLFRGGRHDANVAWAGCQAGMGVLGIEANGAIKGCPSLPTSHYVGGNIRDRALHELVNTPELTFNLGGGTPEGEAHLWGFCKGCDFARLCRGGCSWTSHVFFDRRGNNPYCHHRALIQASRGVRERFQQTQSADGLPFDNGIFELLTEPLGAAWPESDPLHFTKDHIVWPEDW